MSGNLVMSVVLAARSLPDVAKILECLAAQTIRDQLELVIVIASEFDGDTVPGTLSRYFSSHQVIALEASEGKAAANALGARSARGHIVAFAEDHCFPAPDWAERLLEAYQGSAAAVGPRIVNANPDSLVSWGDLMIHYGAWVGLSSKDFADALPGFNASYRRAVLEEFDEGLEEWFAIENELHREMRQRGRTLRFEAGATVHHVNISKFRAWAEALCLEGRIYAALRSRSWQPTKRVFYALASPIFPLRRALQILGDWPERIDALPHRVQILPVLLAGLVADAVGQMLGFVLGIGDAERRAEEFEYARAAHVRPGERALLVPDPKGVAT